MKSNIPLMAVLGTILFLASPTYYIFARTGVPVPEYYSHGLFINDQTQQCNIAKIEDKFFKYSYPPEFKLTKTFFLDSSEKFVKVCPNGYSCEFSNDQEEATCKEYYLKSINADGSSPSEAEYATCKLTHNKCFIGGYTNHMESYLPYVSIQSSKTTFKTSSIPYLVFITFTFIFLPLLNVIIGVKKLFSERARKWILRLSVTFWVFIFIGWWVLFCILIQ